jgi:hypothetical protein
MNRRDFIVSAVAGSTLMELGRRPADADTIPVLTVIYDERFAEARAYAAAIRPLGAALFATRGDTGALWYGPVGARIRRLGGCVAGMTTYADFVLAKGCGRELGLRPTQASPPLTRSVTNWLLR